jgi:hypothetical protein
MTLRWMGTLFVLTSAACSQGPDESEYYQAYLQMEYDWADMASQLDSTMLRIRDIESAITDAESELEDAYTAAVEAQLAVTRDPPAAEYHAQNAQQYIQRAQSRLTDVN